MRNTQGRKLKIKTFILGKLRKELGPQLRILHWGKRDEIQHLSETLGRRTQGEQELRNRLCFTVGLRPAVVGLDYSLTSM